MSYCCGAEMPDLPPVVSPLSSTQCIIDRRRKAQASSGLLPCLPLPSPALHHAEAVHM
jgi:hypothetical protein